MTYLNMVQRAKALLARAQEAAEAAGDDWTADEIHQAIAWCRNAEIMAESANNRGTSAGLT